jgi:hypothetical protein
LEIILIETTASLPLLSASSILSVVAVAAGSLREIL